MTNPETCKHRVLALTNIYGHIGTVTLPCCMSCYIYVGFEHTNGRTYNYDEKQDVYVQVGPSPRVGKKK